jgi:hypothetical protein
VASIRETRAQLGRGNEQPERVLVLHCSPEDRAGNQKAGENSDRPQSMRLFGAERKDFRYVDGYPTRRCAGVYAV